MSPTRSGTLRKLSIAFFFHSIRSDWNNGNAHFLRGLLRALTRQGHRAVCFERRNDWSIDNLLLEGVAGAQSLTQFHESYPEIAVQYFDEATDLAAQLRDFDFVIVHEWNPPELIDRLLALAETCGFRTLFHDTHHRASSSPEAIRRLQVPRFDGVLAFGQALQRIYQRDFGLEHVYVLHEAADTSIFHPPTARLPKANDVVWIGNWGDDERSGEIRTFLLDPAAALRARRFTIYGVRYPDDALEALSQSGVGCAGYLPNLDAPSVYATARLTVHIPRQQYTGAMAGIPTIRVFEALACGIPLVSAPWQDTEQLFREGDFLFIHSADEMRDAIEHLLDHPEVAEAQAARGLETVLARHTCDHRATELVAICHEVLHP